MRCSTRASCRWLASVFVLALAGCGHATGNALPPLVEYSPSFQQQMKSELPTVRKCCPATNEFVKDSIKLREKVKAGHHLQRKSPFKLFKR